VAGNIYRTRTGFVEYFQLKKINKVLAEDNARLREANIVKTTLIHVPVSDTSAYEKDPTNYGFLAARVINNSTQHIHNFLTIDKGTKHGVEPGMGVISDKGVVGKVMATSQNFSTIASLLNTDLHISAKIRNDGTFCTVNWDGRNALISRALYLPRHLSLQEGDSIMTSGYNAIFPEDVMLGTIRSFSLESNATFFDVDINLSNNFYNLSYVYVVKNPLKEEQETLESQYQEEIEQ
jgi:rod shape-determining protein MreC